MYACKNMIPFEDIEKLLSDLHTKSLTGAPELRALYDNVINGIEKPLIVELGSYCGASSFVLASAAQQKNGKLICVDSFKDKFDGQLFTGNEARKEWHRVMDSFGNVRLYDMKTSQGAKKFGFSTGEKIDLLFVDADHSYKGVLADLICWNRFVKYGGTVILHDYYNEAFKGVKKAADEVLVGWGLVHSIWSMAILQKPEVA